MLRALITLLAFLSLMTAATAQQTQTPDRSATGGAQTLQDIMARQRGETVDDSFRRDATGNPDVAAKLTGQLGTLGGASDPELWRALRYNSANVIATTSAPGATVLIQDGGIRWLELRRGPLATYGGFLLLGTIVVLGLFYAYRGRILISGKKTGRKIERFKTIERFGHWLLAGSFILLGLTGLISLIGRKFLIPAFGHEAFSTLATGSKFIHDNVSWAFMVALVMIFVMWVMHNLPDRSDLHWLAKGGGMLSGEHPPAKKFNAGQKLIFWAVIILGTAISTTGLMLLFPFEIKMFASTFETLNNLRLPQAFGMGELQTALAPHEEMQYAQLFHAMYGLVLMAIILAHIYIGTVGMEGAYDAMDSGQVEEQWAREHHSLWAKEMISKDGKKAPKAAKRKTTKPKAAK